MHALHAIEQTVGSDVQYENYRSDGTILMLAAPTKGGVDVLDVASAELAPTPGTTMQFMAPDATKGGVDEEEAAQSYLGRTSWCLFQVLASVVPRRSSSAKGAVWRSSVVGYLLIWGEATRVAAETSVRGRSGRSESGAGGSAGGRWQRPRARGRRRRGGVRGGPQRKGLGRREVRAAPARELVEARGGPRGLGRGAAADDRDDGHARDAPRAEAHRGAALGRGRAAPGLPAAPEGLRSMR